VGANVHSHQATPGDVQPPLPQVNGTPGDMELCQATGRICFGSRRSRVRIPPSRPFFKYVVYRSSVPAIQGTVPGEPNEAFIRLRISLAREQTLTQRNLQALVALLKSCRRLGYLLVLPEVSSPFSRHEPGS